MIVRPSTAADIRPAYPSQLLSTPGIPSTIPKTWGSSGNSIFDLQAHNESQIPPAKWPEEDRKFDEVKVKSSDDPTVFVTTQVMTQFRANNPVTGKIGFTQNFAPPKETENIEIVSRGNVQVSSLK